MSIAGNHPRPPRVRDGIGCRHQWEFIVAWKSEVGRLYGCPACGAVEYRIPTERHKDYEKAKS